MTKLPADLEALMPEPVGRIHHYAANHTPRIEWFRRPGNVGDKLFTADQVREAILAATERAAKVCAAAEMSPVVDDQDRLFNYAVNHCAAAIRGTA